MGNNEYLYRPWHLAEEHHITNWTTQQIVRYIKRRDPLRPSLWYLSYCHPHPPLVPLRDHLDLYRDVAIDPTLVGEWARDPEALPAAVRRRSARFDADARMLEGAVLAARRAFYALCTHIDHQLRYVIGTLREERLIDNTIILFTSDHGDMLGMHGLRRKRCFYEYSAQIPMLLMGVAGDERVGHDRTENRLVGHQDVMPTLLDLAGIPIPESVEGLSMAGERRRAYLYGEVSAGQEATRMLHDGRHKLIYYPAGNSVQLFDLEADPMEMRDVASAPDYAAVRQGLEQAPVSELCGGDEAWARDGRLVGMPAEPAHGIPDRGLSGRRGRDWPPPGKP